MLQVCHSASTAAAAGSDVFHDDYVREHFIIDFLADGILTLTWFLGYGNDFHSATGRHNSRRMHLQLRGNANLYHY